MKRIGWMAILAAAALSAALIFSLTHRPSGTPAPRPNAGAALAEQTQRTAAALEAPPQSADTDAPVYYTPGGLCYHAVSDCSNMKNAQAHPVDEAIAAGKRHCPVCQPVVPVYGDWFRAAFGQALDGLYPGYRYRRAIQDERDFFLWRVSNGWREASVCVVEQGALCFDPAPMNWAAGSVRLTLRLDDTSDAPAFLNAAPEPVRAMAGYDLSGTAGEAGFDIGPLSDEPSPAAAADALQAVFDRDGRLTGLALQFSDSQGVYRAEWTLEADQYRLYLSVQTDDYFMRTPEPLASVPA